jgi:hypothetical protein
LVQSTVFEDGKELGARKRQEINEIVQEIAVDALDVIPEVLDGMNKAMSSLAGVVTIPDEGEDDEIIGG